MNAIQFIKENGVEKAREVVEGAPTGTNHYCADNYWFWDGTTLKRTAGDVFFIHSIWGAREEWVRKAVSLPDLKRLVDSVDLVTAWGGLESTYSKFRYAQEHKNTYAANMIQQAIADCESIYGGEHV